MAAGVPDPTRHHDPAASEPSPSRAGRRYALKNPENLTDNQQAKLAWIAATDPRLYRAYLLEKALRVVFQLPKAAAEALDLWISWAPRCRIPAFVDLQRRIVKTPRTDSRRD